MKRQDNDLSLTPVEMFRIAQGSYYLGQLTFRFIKENPYFLTNMADLIAEPISKLQNLVSSRKA